MWPRKPRVKHTFSGWLLDEYAEHGTEIARAKCSRLEGEFIVKRVEEDERVAIAAVTGLPGVAPVSAVCESVPFKPLGRHYAVFPLLETFDDMVRRGLVSPENVLVWARQLAGTVVALHEKLVMHRDIKPWNLLFRSLPGNAYEVLLTDWGSAITNDSSVTQLVAYLSTDMFAPAKGSVSPMQRDMWIDWCSLIYTVAWMLGDRWGSAEDPVAERPSLVDLAKHEACRLLLDLAGVKYAHPAANSPEREETSSSSDDRQRPLLQILPSQLCA